MDAKDVSSKVIEMGAYTSEEPFPDTPMKTVNHEHRRFGDDLAEALSNINKVVMDSGPRVHDIATDQTRDATQADIDGLHETINKLKAEVDKLNLERATAPNEVSTLPPLDDETWKTTSRDSLIDGGFIKAPVYVHDGIGGTDGAVCGELSDGA